ncbi:MAG: ABC transporter substrate-binding protein [Planctomycetota bacterium]|jgi:branched-chain amino acid transport system substrate-binding protein
MVSRILALFAIFAICGLVLLPACEKKEEGGTAGPGTDAKGGEVVIAVAGPMTGSAAAFGEQIRNAANLKTKEINDAGGINGKTLRLIIEDDKGETTEATNVARKIVSDDSVAMVIGHFNSTCSNAAKEEYNRKKIVSLSPGSTNISVCAGYEWTFRNLYRDDYQGDFLAHYAKKKLGAKKVAIFYDNDDYGKGLMKSFKAEAEKIGLEVVGVESYIRERTQDFKPIIQNVQASEPEAIFVAGLYNEGALICKAARTDLGLKTVFLGGDGLMNEKFIEIAGKAAEAAYITTPFLFNTGADSPEAKKFLEAYRKAYNKEPDTWAALTYDAVGMAVEAIKAVGTDRAKIREWLAACTTPEKAYKGVTGLTYFDKEGDCYSKPAYVAQVKDKKFVPAPKQLSQEELDQD